MAITVNGLWMIYIIVAIASFIILWILFALVSRCRTCTGLNWGTAFLWGTLIGALTVFILGFWINQDTLSDGEWTSLSVLYLVAFILPIFTAIILMWTSGHFSWKHCGCKKQQDPCKKSEPCKDECAKPDPCKKQDPCDPCDKSVYSRW